MALAASSLAVLTATPAQAADPIDIQILATNDFHGRLTNNTNNEAGAAVLSGAVKQLRTENPNTNFVAAGDLIGASTFESFIQQDVPTIEALNEASLDVSAVGNHELDQGFDDLNVRVQNLADWEYIVANLRLKAGGAHALAPTWTNEIGGVTVGYVGAVTEDLPALVSPAGISTLDVTDIVTEVNASAAALQADGADVVVMLVHEGAPSTNCATMDDSGAWADIINNVSSDVNAIVSGHTHLAYNCQFPVAGLSHERPVVSAGQYGTNLNKLVFTVDPDDGAISAVTQEILPLEGPDPDGSGPGVPPSLYPADPVVTQIVADAVTEANVLGAVELGEIEGPFDRARWSAPDGDDAGTERDIVENRGGESTLGNLVAEVQRWATEPAEFGAAEIAFMNPGGLRANMTGLTVTYRQAANVQPFANTLVNMTLTGAQIKTVLEQQWQRDAGGNVPSRPFLRLGTSDGFEYSYDPIAREGSKVTGIWLNDDPVLPGETFSVTVNSFLAAGGDNFREFANGTDKRDTGQVDLQAMVDYMEEFTETDPLPVDSSQHSVGAKMTDTVNITLTSLSMTGANDVKDTEVEVFEGVTSLGTFPVTSDLTTTPFDESGTATLPNPNLGTGHVLRVVGATTGTEAVVNVLQASGVAATAPPVTYGTDWTANVNIDPNAATGTVEILNGTTSLGTAPADNDGNAVVAIDGTALSGGAHTLTVRYLGDTTYAASEDTFDVTVAKAASTTSVSVEPEVAVAGQDQITLTSTVDATGFTPGGEVEFKLNGVSLGTAPLEEGAATLVGGPINATGTFEVTAHYLGDGNTEVSTSAEAAELKVVKAAADLSVKIRPGTIKVDRTRAKVVVRADSGGDAARGKVEVKVGGKTYTRTLDDGRAVIRLSKFAKTGKKTVRVKYLGNAVTKSASTKVTFKVVNP